MDEHEPRELTTRQAADLAGVSGQYIRRLLAEGRIKGRQPDDWVWLVDRADLVRWMRERDERRSETRH